MTRTESTTPLLATAYDADGDPREWVLHDMTGRQAVLVRAFLRSIYGHRAVNVSFLGRETFADFVAFHGEEYVDRFQRRQGCQPGRSPHVVCRQHLRGSGSRRLSDRELAETLGEAGVEIRPPGAGALSRAGTAQTEPARPRPKPTSQEKRGSEPPS